MSDFPDLQSLWNYDDPEETAVRFYELLPSVAASTNRAYHVALLSQIARTHSLRGQFDEANRLLDEAEAMLTPEMTVPHLRCLLERGRTHLSAGDKAKALPLFHEAFAQGTNAGVTADFHTIDAAHMIAIVKSDSADSLKWDQIALDLAEATPDTTAQGWRGSLYNNIGWTFHDMGQFEKALAIFEKALGWQEANPRARPESVRVARWCIGRTLRSLNRLAEALALQQALLTELQEAGGADGFVIEEIGECLLGLDRKAEARPYFAQAHAELSRLDWLASSDPERLARLARLGRGEG